jgi:hypothetical protein
MLCLLAVISTTRLGIHDFLLDEFFFPLHPKFLRMGAPPPNVPNMMILGVVNGGVWGSQRHVVCERPCRMVVILATYVDIHQFHPYVFCPPPEDS